MFSYVWFCVLSPFARPSVINLCIMVIIPGTKSSSHRKKESDSNLYSSLILYCYFKVAQGSKLRVALECAI